MADHHHPSNNSAHSEVAHGSVKLYWVFAAILCVITFCEWGIFKKRNEFGISNHVLVTALLTMSLVKFVMVCGWYMHLRYDKKFLTNFLVVAMLMASAIFLAINLLVHH